MFFFGKKKTEISGVGQRGEDLAVEFLRKKGYGIVARNYSNPKGRRLGEIDIVAQKDGMLIFVEVKTRESGGEAVFPEENIDRRKLLRLQKAANHFIRKRGCLDKRYRFDAVSVVLDPVSGKAGIRHLESIFF